jgi:hypothetical protein
MTKTILGFHERIGPIYRHFAEYRYRLISPHCSHLFRALKHRYGVRIRHWQGRTSVKLGADKVRRAGLNGTRLIVRRRATAHCDLVYRTLSTPRHAGKELRKLFTADPPAGLGLPDVKLKLNGVLYIEFYVALSASEAHVVRRFLRKAHARRCSRLGRRGIRTLYSGIFHVPIQLRGTLPVAFVLYLPRKTKTPGYVKLELKSPYPRHKPINLTNSIRNRLLCLLRHVLASLNVKAQTKPQPWKGTIVSRNYKLGPVERAVRARHSIAGDHSVSTDDLLRSLGRMTPFARRNLLETLRKMERIGDVTLVRREGRIRSIRLFRASLVLG